ncbi:MAG: hypothetical protein AAB388_01890 [Patescibacteria group bacterium]
MKNLTIPIIIFALIFGLFTFATPVTNAACSYSGYVNSNGKCANSFKQEGVRFQIFSSDDVRSRLLETYIERLRELIRLLEARLGNVNVDSDVEVTTRSATDVDTDEATLRGRVDLNTEDQAEVFFQYGKTMSNLNLQTAHEDVDDDSNELVDFSAQLEDLADDTVYYFRAVAEDEEGDRNFGSILRFRTDADEQENDIPTADTNDAKDVTDDSAELHGSIDMNDFDNGRAFFVYGEDENMIGDVENDFDTYNDVDEDGDNLHKILIDADVDGSESFTSDILNLDNDTDFHFRMCVEFEDEDNEEMIVCGDTESFETDSN